ncbi:MAG: redoxin domain-containing protein [Gemmatimonadaceae bacterium]|nr:redoxin domain-containing protein [Gemmatimonadaceae bacterium]
MRFTFLLMLFGLAGCQRGLQGAMDALPAEGSQLPPFTLELLDGRQVSTADLRGQPSVVALWSSTCGASRKALAGIAALQSEYAARGLRVLVLADDASAQDVQTALDSAGLRVPVALAAGQINPLFAPTKRWPWQKGVALPSFLVVDSAGIVRQRIVGIEEEPTQRMQRVRRALSALIS